MATTLHPPQFMAYFHDPSHAHWVPEIINYNGNPYMLVGDSLEEIWVSWSEENAIDPVEPDEFRVVNTFYNNLYRLNEDRSGFVEIEESPDLQGADKSWFAVR